MVLLDFGMTALVDVFFPVVVVVFILITSILILLAIIATPSSIVVVSWATVEVLIISLIPSLVIPRLAVGGIVVIELLLSPSINLFAVLSLLSLIVLISKIPFLVGQGALIAIRDKSFLFVIVCAVCILLVLFPAFNRTVRVNLTLSSATRVL